MVTKKSVTHINISAYAFDYKYYKRQPYEYFVQLHPDVNDTQLSDTWIN